VDAPRYALAELAHVFLHRGARDRSTRSLLQLIGRLAPFCLRILALVIVVGGGAGALVASQLVYLVVLLVAPAAIDQWRAANWTKDLLPPAVDGRNPRQSRHRGRSRICTPDRGSLDPAG
jgi:hypothetical protein